MERGQSDHVLINVNPYSGDILSEVKMATVTDVDLAYKAALKAKDDWDKVNPYKKEIFLKSSSVY